MGVDGQSEDVGDDCHRQPGFAGTLLGITAGESTGGVAHRVTHCLRLGESVTAVEVGALGGGVGDYDAATAYRPDRTQPAYAAG